MKNLTEFVKGEMSQKKGFGIANDIYFVVMMAVLVLGGVIFSRADLQNINVNWIVNMSLDLFGMALSAIIFLSIMFERKLDKKNIALLRMISFIHISLFWDICCWAFDGNKNFILMIKAANTLFYLNGAIIALLFWFYVIVELELKGKIYSAIGKVINCMCVLNMVFLFLNWFYDIYFTVDSMGVFHRNTYFVLAFVPGAIVILSSIVMIIVQKGIKKSEKIILLTYTVFPIIGIVIQNQFYGLSVIFPCVLLSVVLIYNSIHLQRNTLITMQKSELSKQNVALMISQIQPHFLYNSLTTIANLCRKDPVAAEEVTVMFSTYLRTNLDSIKCMEPVPFLRELNHVKTYLELEKRRFGDRLNIVYDIEESNFFVPALAIQPIVENSVKHGICEKGEPGTLFLSTKRVENGVNVIVEDDGVGFDLFVPKKETKKSSIGMSNVVKRVEKMCGGTVLIETSPGKGCKTVIFFPDRH